MEDTEKNFSMFCADFMQEPRENSKAYISGL